MLDDIMRLDFDTREMLLDILKRRQIESRRDEIAENGKKALKEYRSGKAVPKSAEEVIAELNAL
jgi:hypothetical protein